MEAARSAVNKITSLGGTHDTTVEESVKPAVTSETVKPTRHEEFQEAVNKEVHQDHYHTTVQPLQHREVLPERHEHRQQPVQEREFHHGDHTAVQRGVQAEHAAFTDSSLTANTAHSSSQAAAVTGEHVHHHVHETVQPIVHKETIQPEVVHTTIPIHERHQAPSEHHGLSTMPVKTLDEFKTTGVPLTGTGHRTEHYEGDPRHYNPSMQIKRNDVDVNPQAHDGPHDGSSHAHSANTAAVYGAGSTGTGIGTGTGLGTSASSAQTGSLRGAEHGTSSHGIGNVGGLSQGTSSTGLGTGTSSGHTGILSGAEHNTSGHGIGNTGGLSQGTGTSSGHTGILGGAEHNTSGHGIGNTGGLSQGTSSTGFGTGTSAAQTGALRAAEHSASGQGLGATGTRSTDNEYSSRDTTGVTPAHNITTADHSTRDTGAYSTPSTAHTDTHTSSIGHTGTHTSSHGPADSAHTGHHHVEGHGTSNQIHHGSSLDNHARDDPNSQHGTQTRDPAVVDDKSDKKLTGTGVDGSHSAFFGLTPDGHKHKETSSATTAPVPAHSNDGVGNVSRPHGNDTVAGQLNNPNVAEKGHSGKAEYDVGSTKPGAGATGGSQGFGEVRPQDHGATSQVKNKLDPSTDADGDGKRGVLD